MPGLQDCAIVAAVAEMVGDFPFFTFGGLKVYQWEGAEEMAQWLRALDCSFIEEGLGLILRIHVMAHNHLYL